jgi:serine protease Do
MRNALLLFAAVLLPSLESPAGAEDRNTQVKKDLERALAEKTWIYNDLPKAFEEARTSGKPILAVLRCIPCEACRGFDEQVAGFDPRVKELLEKFVRLRIPQTNGLDLSLFQVDFDLSFSAVFLNADRTIYGRFGSQSTQQDKTGEVSIGAFKEAMAAVLDLHGKYDQVKASLKAKSPGAPRYKSPEEYPYFNGKFTSRIDYQSKNVAGTCIHCHQVREAEREACRSEGPLSDRVLFAWPLPDTVGLKLDPRKRATVASVEKRSTAERGGLQAGDELLSVAGQPIISITDVQWILHNAPDEGAIEAVARRGKDEVTLKVPLEKGWRKRGDLSWRVSTWDLRRIAIGGLLLKEATAEERKKAGLADGVLALRVEHAGEYGEHATAKNAGVNKEDIIVEVDGKSDPLRETDIIAQGVQQKKPGDPIQLTIVRGGERKEISFAIK